MQPGRIVAFDAETTGTDPATSRIVEISFAPAGGPVETFRVDPGVPIPPEATAVHGIRDEDVAGAPRFADVAAKVQALVEGATLLGYNSRAFDAPLLHAELVRAGQKGLDLEAAPQIDVYRVWAALEPRTLAGALRRWTGDEHVGAHGAAADVEATLRVWARMKALRELDDEAGARLTRPTNEIDAAGKFVLDDAGNVVLSFGKHRGKPVQSIDPSYFAWMMQSDFPASTKSVISRLLANGGDLPEAVAYRATLPRAPTTG